MPKNKKAKAVEEDEDEVEETEEEEEEEAEDEDSEEEETEDEDEASDEDEDEEEEEEGEKPAKGKGKGKKGKVPKGLVPRTPVSVSKAVFKAQPKEVQKLLKARDEAIAKGDKKAQRKIRMALRKAGFRLQDISTAA